MISLIFIFTLVCVRAIETYLFINKVSKICFKYDWKYVNNHDELVLEILKKNYYLTNEWSAYNFMFMKGPSVYSLFFSFKRLTIEKQYNKFVVKILKDYEII